MGRWCRSSRSSRRCLVSDGSGIPARLAGLTETNPNKIVRATFAAITGDSSEAAWNKFLHDGFAAGTAMKKVSASWNSSSLSEALSAPTVTATSKDNLEVVLYRDAKLDDESLREQRLVAGVAGPGHEDCLGQRGAGQPHNGARAQR